MGRRLVVAGLLLLTSGCSKPVAAPATLDGTLGNWYADATEPDDSAHDAAVADATNDATADASDTVADTQPGLPDAATPDAATPDIAAPDTMDALADAVTADAGDASLPDSPDTAAVVDVADVPDVPDVAPLDTGPPGVCFKGAPPSGDAFVADILPDDPATCPTTAPPAAWFTTVPAPTLVVTPGTLGADGTFAAYENDAWVPIVYGQQGGFHVWAGFTVGKIANATAPTLALDVQIWADTSCVTVASGVKSKETTVQVGDGQYANVFTGSNGIPTQFYVPAGSAYLYCGLWLNLHIRVHDPVSGAWGEAVRSLRVYDSKP